MLGSNAVVSVRKGRVSDAGALAEVFAAAWCQAYSGIIPHRYLQSMIARRGPEWWRQAARSRENILTLQVVKKTVGYATFGPARRRSSQRGEIYELYLDPVHQGLGFGEYLFEGCRHGLDERSFRGLIVWALRDNTAATDFYWRRGGRPIAEVQENVGGRKLAKVGFVWQ